MKTCLSILLIAVVYLLVGCIVVKVWVRYDRNLGETFDENNGEDVNLVITCAILYPFMLACAAAVWFSKNTRALAVWFAKNILMK